MSNKTVSRWENGIGFPDVSLLQPLCALLNIDVNELLLGEKIPKDDYRKKVEENTIRILEECRFSLENGRYFKNTEKTIDLGFFGIVAIVLVTLKLTGTIHWSWLWILSPLWIGLILCALLVTIGLIITKKKLWGKIDSKISKIKFKFF